MAAFDLLRSALLGPWGPRLLPQTIRLELVRLRFDSSFTWKAERRLMEAGMRLALRAYTGPEPCVYTSLFTPPELVHALGLVPFGLESAGGIAASLGIAGHALRLAEEGWLPADACTVLRAAVGGVRTGLLPRPAALLCTSAVCDSTAGAFGEAARHLGVPLLLLDVPCSAGTDGDGEAGVRYLADQMERAAGELADITGQPFRAERLAEACRLSNLARASLSGIQELRRRRPGLLAADDALAFLYPTSLLLGGQAGVDVFRAFYEDLAAAVPTRPYDVDGPRLLWLHLLPYYPHHLLGHLRGAGAIVVGEEMSGPFWDELDPDDPFTSLARKCIHNPWNGPLTNRIAALRRLIREQPVDGAVHFSHWGCRQSTAALSVLADAMQQEGVPLLVLDGDLVDARSYSDGQHRTRLEGFVEMLEARRERGSAKARRHG